jgi:GntR family transcriptional regulator/MocR family aminotransferase
MSRATLPFDTITIERSSDVPVHRQIYDRLRSYILRGLLPPGSRLPSTRDFAATLSVARNSVIAAYEQLLIEGYIESKVGFGTVVSQALGRSQSKLQSTLPQRSPELSQRGAMIGNQPHFGRSPRKLNFHPGYPETEAFPFLVWSRLLARRARSRSEDILTYFSFCGHPDLREAIAQYVAVARGVVCTPQQVIVVTGAQAGLDLLARTLLDPGDTAWLEEPGYIGARAALLAGGARIAPLRVSEDGWSLSDPELPAPRLIYITPSCQWPTGVIMRLEERLQLLELASHYNAWIVEDDYDGEYRFRGKPVSAMQGLDSSDRVIYVGTFGKTLFSSLRIGYLIVPTALVEPIDRALAITGQFAPLIMQGALADFIREGHFATHLKRMRSLYAVRQAYLLQLCTTQLSEWMNVPANESGIQLLGRFRRPFDDRCVAQEAALHGIDAQPLSANFNSDEPQHGLLLGYARLAEREIQAAVVGLGEVFHTFDAQHTMSRPRRGKMVPQH